MRNRTPAKSAAFVGLVAAATVAAATVAETVAAGTGSAAALSGPPTADQMRRAYADLSAAVRDLPRDQFDPAAVLEQVGRDPATLLAWVRDRTALLPYRGALRGPRGVLMDRGGNSLDRALLLAALLRRAGTDVRLANATLSPDAAARVAARAAASAARRAPVNPTPPDASMAADRDRVSKLADRIVAAIGPLTPAADPTVWADHWWVQAELDGKWTDLDPTGDNAKPGDAPAAAAARTVPLPADAGDGLPLPAADVHEVDVNVVVEAFAGGRLTTETVLSRTLRPAEVLGRPITFTHTVGTMLGAETTAATPAAVAAAVLKQAVYLPTLWVGDQPTARASVDVTGHVDANPHFDPAGQLAGGTARVFGNMFGSFGGGGGGSAAPAGVWTAEWLEYVVRVPGRPPRAVRREVFDLIGPAARAAGVTAAPRPADADRLARGLRLLGKTSILLQPCDLPGTFAGYQFAAAELADRDLWLAAAGGAGPAADRAYAEAFGRSARRGLVPLTVAAARAALGEGGTFIDQPNVICCTRFTEVDGGELVARSRVDLALTGTAAAPGVADPGRARIRQGVADTLAEHLALGRSADPAGNAVGVSESAAAVTVARTAADLGPLNLPPDAHARAAADLAAGQALVLAPAGSAGWAWWRVDPATGQTVGVMGSGYNQAMTEKELNEDCASYSRTLDMKIDPKVLRNATPEQLAQWAARHPANPAGCLQNLQRMQDAARVIWDLKAALRGGLA